MITGLFILFVVLTVATAITIEVQNPFLTSIISILASIALSMFFILIIEEKRPIGNTNHTGYTVDTTYTIKNGVKQGVTYTVKEKKK